MKKRRVFLSAILVLFIEMNENLTPINMVVLLLTFKTSSCFPSGKPANEEKVLKASASNFSYLRTQIQVEFLCIQTERF